MSCTAAFEFLYSCLSHNSSPAASAALLQAAQSPSFAWETFVRLASETLVAPAVFNALQSKNIVEAVPEDVVDFFDGMAILNRQRNEQLVVEVFELATVLNEVNVVPVFLKGAAHLLSGLYLDPAERLMADLDVLVPADHLSVCAAHLCAKGYQALTDANYSEHHHYQPLGRPDRIAIVELHDEPLDLPYRRLLASHIVFGETIMIRSGAAKLAVPSARCRLIHAVAHPQLADHAYLYGKLPLRELLDFARLHEAFAYEIDWREFARHFAACGAATALEFHLLAANRLFKIPIDPHVRISTAARALYRRALWQAGHPTWSRLGTRLLRPCLLLRRSLSHDVLRRRLVRNLGDWRWYRRQWRMFCS
jgi:Uncharacterised nucleotidyltransferase